MARPCPHQRVPGFRRDIAFDRRRHNEIGDHADAGADLTDKMTRQSPSQKTSKTRPPRPPAPGRGMPGRAVFVGAILLVFGGLLVADLISMAGAGLGVAALICVFMGLTVLQGTPASGDEARASAHPQTPALTPARAPAPSADTGGAAGFRSGRSLPAESAAFGASPAAFLSETLRLAIERFPDPVLLLDAEGRVQLANAASQSYVRDSAANRHISAIIRTPSVLEAVRAVLNGEGGREVEYALLVPVERHIRASVIPLPVPSHASAPAGSPNRDAAESEAADTEGDAQNRDAVNAILLVLHDLTSVKRSEQLRVDFVANASHELRTPLASLNGYIQTLRGHARNDEDVREKFLSIMEDQTERMRRLIDDLLSLSRIELNEHVAPQKSVDLSLVAHDVADALRPIAEDRDQSIILNWQGTPVAEADHLEPTPVIGDRDELVQVIQNLVDNAIKYGRDGGCVHINLGHGVPGADIGTAPGLVVQEGDRDVDSYSDLDSLKSHVQDGSAHGAGADEGYGSPDAHRRAAQSSYSFVSVRDNGIGIPREHLPRLTERFYRVDANMSRKIGGTGLGLAIVKHIVNRHRGWMSIDSRADAGSTFTVFLPRASHDAHPKPEANEAAVIPFRVSEKKGHAAE